MQTPSKIIGIQFSLFSPEEIEKSSVVEVTNKETYVGMKPKIGGLFDPRMGVLEPGMLCPTDNMNYIQCPGYFGHIKLAKPVFYIQYLDTIINVMKCVCIKCGRLRISKRENQYLMKYPNEKRWKMILEKHKQKARCGDENENGCGCLQPERIRQNGFANIVASWVDENENKEGMQLTFTPEMTIQLFKKISDEDVNFMGLSNIWSRPEWMVCQVFAVPPPAMRPSVKHDAQQRSEDDLTHIIINIIKINNKLKQILSNPNESEQLNTKLINDWTQVLQYFVATMVDNKITGASPVTQRSGRALKSISERHKGKTGRVRGNLMGKRVDFSARSVITPDPELSIAELGVPLKIAKNITKPVKVQKNNYHFLYYLVKNGPHVYPGAKIIEKKSGVSISLGYIDRENINLEIGDIVHRHMLDGDYVLFNRQPTLHRMSMMAHIVKVMKHGDSFRMNVADTKPYNADFDGDEMNMHMPQNAEAEAELRYLANVPNQIVSPANNKPIIGIFQDSLIGSFLFTRKNQYITRKEMMNLLLKTNNYSVASLLKSSKEKYNHFELLSEIIPPISLKYKTDLFDKQGDGESENTSNLVLEIKNGTIKRGQFDKGVLGSSSKGIMHRILKDYDTETCKSFVDNLQGIITEYMKTTGFSVGISDLVANEKTNKNIQDIINEKKKDVSKLTDQVHLGIFENKTGKTNEEHFETQVNNTLNQASSEAGKVAIRSLSRDNRFVALVTSGSKGSNINISQMISCLGQQNVDGKRIPYGYTNRTLPHFKQFDDTPKARGFVESSFINGLSPDELFFHAMGGRIGLIDTAVKTSTTGYIQRRLIKGMEDIQIMYDKTVRNHHNKIIQYDYGGTNFDSTHIETMKFDLIDMDVNMIYERYAYDLLNDDMTKAKQSKHLKLIYESKALTRFKKQFKILKDKALNEIYEIIRYRNLMIEKVYCFQDNNKIYLPIHFVNLIESVKQHCNITSAGLSDITPLEVYEIIEEKYQLLERLFQPCKKFRMVFTFYMNPFYLIHIHKYHKQAIEYLCERIIHIYKKAVVNPGEMVGMISAQSIGEPTTQMTLNTFHYAGVSSKSNVTRGVPRIEELLQLTKNLKNPSLTIQLKEEQSFDIKKSYDIASKIEHTRLVDIIQKAEIYYEPDDSKTLIHADDKLMQEYMEFTDLLRECYGEEQPVEQTVNNSIQSANENQENVNESIEVSESIEVNDKDEPENNWIIRIEMDERAMFDMNIMNEDIHYILKSTYQDNVSCFYSDYNDEGKIVFRIRPKYNIGKKKETDSFTQEDYVYYVKTFMEKILNDTVIRGVKDIEKVNLRKINGYKVYDEESNNYNKKDIYVLDTVGTNLYDVLALDFIDRNRTFSNDVMEMYQVLGIEAARRCLFEEIMDVMEFDGAYVNHHHLHLLCDRMTCNEKMVSIFRHGINKDDIGPIAKASFEETTEMFLQAAKHGTLDNMRGVSANVMCGQEGLYGTSCFQVYIDSNKLFKQQQDMGYTSEDDDESPIPYDIDLDKKSPETILKELSYVQNDTFGACSMENLKQISALDDDLNQIVSVKEDDGYELDDI
jgi:DNA-directed RNA polymerase II subunit RPB1